MIVVREESLQKIRRERAAASTAELEQNITDLELAAMEQEIAITELELSIMEMKGGQA